MNTLLSKKIRLLKFLTLITGRKKFGDQKCGIRWIMNPSQCLLRIWTNPSNRCREQYIQRDETQMDVADGKKRNHSDVSLCERLHSVRQNIKKQKTLHRDKLGRTATAEEIKTRSRYNREVVAHMRKHTLRLTHSRKKSQT